MGQNPRTVASVSVVPVCLPLSVEYPAAPLLTLSWPVGVGLAPSDNEDPLPSVWRSNVGSAYRHPERIIPARGKVAENAIQSSGNKGADVLHDDKPGCQLANDAVKFLPKTASLTVDSSTSASE